MKRWCVLVLVLGMLSWLPAYASPAQAYRQALSLAQQGKDAQAVALLTGASMTMSEQDGIWRSRIVTAKALLQMRMQRATNFHVMTPGIEANLVERFLASHPAPKPASPWMAGVVATILPGAGHAYLGRWRDAWTAACLVWPMFALTLWAMKRRMGPVTVFFAILTTWLWSGTVFSAVSLSERGMLTEYMRWWQGVWEASGLPGRPW